MIGLSDEIKPGKLNVVATVQLGEPVESVPVPDF